MIDERSSNLNFLPFLFIGTFFGLAASAIALVVGTSWLFALVIYTLVSTTICVLAIVFLFAKIFFGDTV